LFLGLQIAVFQSEICHNCFKSKTEAVTHKNTNSNKAEREFWTGTRILLLFFQHKSEAETFLPQDVQKSMANAY
jgi:hypothetical protein